MNRLIHKMVEYYSGDPNRIQHFLKVHSLAKLIAFEEGADPELLRITEAAAVVHDIGIKVAEEKYQSCVGPLQEKEGPPMAEAMLRELGESEELIERVCWLVGHHHTYDNIDGLDYRVLVEADFLVNLYEESSGPDAVRAALNSVFATETGIKLCKTMFKIEE